MRIHSQERGFTLIELLVVMLIIGILAGIAIPVFLNQQNKAGDASSKENARNAVSEVESCFTAEQDYRNCTSTATLGGTNLPIVLSTPASGTNQVQVAGATLTSYQVIAASKSGNTYTITKNSDGSLSRTCATAPANQYAQGGCNAVGSW